MSKKIRLIYVTNPNETSARSIAGELIEKHIVACVNMFPISSMYWWEGKVSSETEWVTIYKTTKKRLKECKKTIKLLHPYETPCIISIKTKANRLYKQWIKENTVK